MPKYLISCNNPFHDEWSEGVKGSRIVNLRVFGSSELAHAFANFIFHEKEIKSRKVNHVFFSCLQQCLKKRSFTRHFTKKSTGNEIKKKVGHKMFIHSHFIIK